MFLESNHPDILKLKHIINKSGRLAFHYAIEAFIMGEMELPDGISFEVSFSVVFDYFVLFMFLFTCFNCYVYIYICMAISPLFWFMKAVGSQEVPTEKIKTKLATQRPKTGHPEELIRQN